MIVFALSENELEVVTQPDHAAFAAELAALWRTEGLPDHPRREELLLAIREHDNGWREADAAPRLDDSSRDRPYDFLRLPDTDRAELWRRGTERWRERCPWAALLICEHARRLLAEHWGQAPYREILPSLDLLRDELLGQLGIPVSALEQDYRFLELTDLISLVACTRWEGPHLRRGLTIAWQGEELALRPFPFAGATTFEIPCRTLPSRRFRGDADLGAELALARWRRRRLRIAPLTS